MTNDFVSVRFKGVIYVIARVTSVPFIYTFKVHTVFDHIIAAFESISNL